MFQMETFHYNHITTSDAEPRIIWSLKIFIINVIQIIKFHESKIDRVWISTLHFAICEAFLKFEWNCKLDFKFFNENAKLKEYLSHYFSQLNTSHKQVIT